jgi:hypothetical protein
VQLNTTVAAVLGLSEPATLRTCCTMVRKTRSGRVDYSDSLTVYLTPTVVVTPPPSQTRAAIGITAVTPSSPPAPGSYAAAAGAGIKRAAEQRALNHQPRKAQKAAPASDSAPLQPQKSLLTQSSQQRQKQSTAGPSNRSPQSSVAGAVAQPPTTVQPSISEQRLEQEQKQLRQYCDARFEAVTSSFSKQLADAVATMRNSMLEMVNDVMNGMRQMVQQAVQQMLQPPLQQPPVAMWNSPLVIPQQLLSTQQQQPLYVQQQQHSQQLQQQQTLSSSATFSTASTPVSVDQLIASVRPQSQQYHGGVGKQLPSQTDDGSVLHPASSSASAGPARNGQAVSNV